MRAETLSVYLCPFYVLTPISNVTGHLRALQASGEVVRLGWGRYALAGTPALPPADLRRPGGRPHLAAVAREAVS